MILLHKVKGGTILLWPADIRRIQDEAGDQKITAITVVSPLERHVDTYNVTETPKQIIAMVNKVPKKK